MKAPTAGSAIAIAFALTLAACGDDDSDATESTPAATSLQSEETSAATTTQSQATATDSTVPDPADTPSLESPADEQPNLDLTGLDVTITNTYRMTGTPDTPFGEPVTVTVNDTTEVETGLAYVVDLGSDTVTMSWSDDPTFDGFERTLEEGFADTYYFEFSQPILDGVTSTADGSSNLVPTVSVESSTTLKIEFTTGMTVGDGQTAVIRLERSSSEVLAGAEITLRNTIQIAAAQDAGGTGGTEVPIEVLLGAPEESLTVTGITGDGVEFPGFITLWDVDVRADAIEFTNVIETEPYPGFFRVIESDTFDRYYLETSADLSDVTPTTSDPAVAAEIDAEGRLVITVGEGYDNRGTGFTVILS